MKDIKKDKARKVYNYVAIVIFLAFLYLPVMVFPFVRSVLSEDNLENRKLATFPEIENISDLVKFPARFDQFWSDNLPFRSTIQQVYANSNFRLFGTPSNSQVVVGKNDGNWHHTWLFYNAIGDGDPLGDVRGTKQLGDEQSSGISAHIKNQTSEMNQMGIDLYYVIIPNKSTIYYDYLPDSVNIVTKESLTTNFSLYLQERGVNNYLFLKDALDAERMKDDGNGLPMYKLLDTHWNDYGAFIGVKELLKMMEPDFHGYDEYNVRSDDYTVATGDLKNFMNLNLDLFDQEIIVEAKAGSKYEERVISGLTNQDRVVETTNSKPLYNKTVLVVGDSFRDAMIPWLSSVYAEVIYMHRNTYKKTMLDEYRPDIVINEGVERYMTKAALVVL